MGDVQGAHIWLPEWGEKPDSLDASFEVVRKIVSKAPKLIPIFAHRYISEEPNLPDNPVLSIYQTDIVCYGVNLPDYLKREFDVPMPAGTYVPEHERVVKFWGQFVS